MSGCAKNCRRDKIGLWYGIVREQLETNSFGIDTSHYSKNDIFDIRCHSPQTLSNYWGPGELARIRVSAEKYLHRIYLTSAQACFHGSCSKYPITSLYLTLKYEGGTWRLVCQAEELEVGLCGNPVIHYASQQLEGAIKEAKRLHENSCCLAIHLALTLIDGYNNTTHANTLLVNPKCHTIHHFEPLGRLDFPVSQSGQLQHVLKSSLSKMSGKLGYRYAGYLTPYCNFQDDNPEYCYLWTTWIELLAILNPWQIPANLGKYLEYRYRKLRTRSSRGEQALMFACYLKEIIK